METLNSLRKAWFENRPHSLGKLIEWKRSNKESDRQYKAIAFLLESNQTIKQPLTPMLGVKETTPQLPNSSTSSYRRSFSIHALSLKTEILCNTATARDSAYEKASCFRNSVSSFWSRNLAGKQLWCKVSASVRGVLIKFETPLDIEGAV